MLYTRGEFVAEQSCRYVDDTFGGSLPMFVASFTSSRKLTPEQIADLKRLINEHEGGGGHGKTVFDDSEYEPDWGVCHRGDMFGPVATEESPQDHLL